MAASDLEGHELIFTCDSTPCPEWVRTEAKTEPAGLKVYLESIEKRYIGTPSCVVALAKNKRAAKTIFQRSNIPTPQSYDLREVAGLAAAPSLVLKPNSGSTSAGVRFFQTPRELLTYLDFHGIEQVSNFIIEEYIAGAEVTIGIIENRQGLIMTNALEILISEPILTLEAKTRRPFPEVRAIDRSEPVYGTLKRWARAAYEKLGCRGYARLDFRVDRRGRPFLLEVNVAPRLGRNEYLAMAAKRSGMPYSELVLTIADFALK
jgi:D-alanine-D-alanine ligase